MINTGRQYVISPRQFFIFDTANDVNIEDKIQLERYFADLYSVFMKKLTAYALTSVCDKIEEADLKNMMSELIAVKKSLHQE